MTHIKTEEKTGRGVYSTFYMAPEQVIAREELLVLNTEDSARVNGTDLQYYTFVFNETQDCLVLGLGELYNHSDDPNVGYKLIDYDGRKVMLFWTLREIKKGEQLFINYTSDMPVDVTKYTKNLVG